MSILLICQNTSGKAAVEERRYVIRDHMVILEGYGDTVLRRDAEELLSIPNGFYRMPTPNELDRYHQAERAKGMIQE